MCTRFILEQARLRAIAAALGLPAKAAEVMAPRDRFNIAPGAPVAALRSLTGVFQPRWGFPSFDTPSAPLVNARAETLADRATFREAYASRRCLVPATGFYEWQKRGRARLPWLFRVVDPSARLGVAPASASSAESAAAPADAAATDVEPAAFFLAGLWQPAAPETGVNEPRLVVVTTPANPVMAPIHERMPALLRDAAAARVWLDPDTAAADLAALLAPAPAATLRAIPISPRVNRAGFDSPACIEPAVHGVDAADADDAGGLF